MSDPKSQTPPYQMLGARLKAFREKRQESLPEVSGAVEIEPEVLERMEQGKQLPSEDILTLLMAHFEIQDDEAVKLWELAGYDKRSKRDKIHEDVVTAAKQSLLMVLAMDAHVLYTNGVNIATDKAGIVMNFTQDVPSSQSPVPVSRVGMSYEQAERVISALQSAVLHGRYASGPKAIAAPKASDPTKTQKTQSNTKPNTDNNG